MGERERRNSVVELISKFNRLIQIDTERAKEERERISRFTLTARYSIYPYQSSSTSSYTSSSTLSRINQSYSNHTRQYSFSYHRSSFVNANVSNSYQSSSRNRHRMIDTISSYAFATTSPSPPQSSSTSLKTSSPSRLKDYEWSQSKNYRNQNYDSSPKQLNFNFERQNHNDLSRTDYNRYHKERSSIYTTGSVEDDDDNDDEDDEEEEEKSNIESIMVDSERDENNNRIRDEEYSSKSSSSSSSSSLSSDRMETDTEEDGKQSIVDETLDEEKYADDNSDEKEAKSLNESNRIEDIIDEDIVDEEERRDGKKEDEEKEDVEIEDDVDEAMDENNRISMAEISASNHIVDDETSSSTLTSEISSPTITKIASFEAIADQPEAVIDDLEEMFSNHENSDVDDDDDDDDVDDDDDDSPKPIVTEILDDEDEDNDDQNVFKNRKFLKKYPNSFEIVEIIEPEMIKETIEEISSPTFTISSISTPFWTKSFASNQIMPELYYPMRKKQRLSYCSLPSIPETDLESLASDNDDDDDRIFLNDTIPFNNELENELDQSKLSVEFDQKDSLQIDNQDDEGDIENEPAGSDLIEKFRENIEKNLESIDNLESEKHLDSNLLDEFDDGREKNENADKETTNFEIKLEDESVTMEPEPPKPEPIRLSRQNSLLEKLQQRYRHRFEVRTVFHQDDDAINEPIILLDGDNRASKRKDSLVQTKCFCGEWFRFSDKHLRCQNCLSACHLVCENLVPKPCIRYAYSTGRSTKKISNYVYPGQELSIPSFLINWLHEIENRCCNNMESDFEKVRLYCADQIPRTIRQQCKDFIERTKNGYQDLKLFDLQTICYFVQYFLGDCIEPIFPHKIWTKYSIRLKKTEPNITETELITELKEMDLPNRQTMSIVLIHLKHLIRCQFQSIDRILDIFGPILFGETQIQMKIQFFEIFLQINNINLMDLFKI
ncbi:mucolipin-3-like [Sarcoptes scabiei]|nr:mucolipin-3-like [Sarcoptes scabiei]